MKEEYLEKLIKQIRACGQTITDNAEKIAGGYKYQSDGLDIYIHLESNGVPMISVEHEFFPDDLIAW